MLKLFFFIIFLCTFEVFAENLQETARDSYLDAFQESYVNNHAPSTKKTDRDYTESYPQSLQPAYGPPKYSYGPVPAPQYGTPPAPVYGPPAPAPVYGPPLQPIYGIPYGLGLSLLDKLKFKLDLFTIGKIILKLVIFKKIVSLIAILCLLLFLPSLKHKVQDNGGNGDDEGDLMRSFGPKKYKAGDEILSNISSYVIDAIDKFAEKHPSKEKCNSVYCKTKKVVQKVDSSLSDKKLMQLYAQEK